MNEQKDLYGRMRYLVSLFEKRRELLNDERYKSLNHLFLSRKMKLREIEVMLETYRDICFGLAFGKADMVVNCCKRLIDKLTSNNFWLNFVAMLDDDPFESLSEIYFNEEILIIIDDILRFAKANELAELPRSVVDSHTLCSILDPWLFD